MKNNIIFILNIIGGIIFFIYIIWIRFIRERLPKDIPFSLNLFIFFTIIIICIMYSFQFIELIKPIQVPSLIQQKPSNFSIQLNYIRQVIYKPLYFLQETIINNKYIYPLVHYLIEKFVKIFVKLELYKDRRYTIYNIVCFLLPRIIVVMFFCIDIFYFKKLDLFYKVLPLGIIPMIFTFLNNCVNNILEKNLQYLENRFIIELNSKDQTEVSNYLYDIDMLHTHKDYNNEDYSDLRYLDIRYFVQIQTTAIWCDKDPYQYKGLETLEARINYAKKHNMNLIPLYVTASDFDDISKQLSKEFYELMPYTIHLQLFLYCQENNLLDKYFRNLLTVITGLYLIGWLFILLISLHTFHFTNFEYIFMQNFQDNIEPFSDLMLR